MKQFLGAVLAAFLLAGCERGNPIDGQSTSSASSDQTTLSLLKSDAPYGEITMDVAAGARILDFPDCADSGIHVHDSLRHKHMLDSLIAHLGLSSAQADSLKAYGAALLASLKDIRTLVDSRTITRDSAMTLVKAARDQFVASVKSILTADQLVLFDAWLQKFWIRPPHGPGRDDPHGRGGRGPGGHRGPGGDDGGGPGGHK